MIAKLNFVSVTGPKNELDHMVTKYLSKYDIHLEYAPSELKSANTLHPFTEPNPYKEAVAHGEELKAFVTDTESEENGKKKNKTKSVEMEASEAIEFIQDMYENFIEEKQAEDELAKEIESLRTLLEKVTPFSHIEYDVEEILKFTYLKYRFGRIPKDHYQKFNEYVYDNVESVFIKSDEDDDYVWGVYFVSDSEKVSVDAAYASLHFERTYMPSEVKGTPRQECDTFKKKIEEINAKLSKNRESYVATIEKDEEKLDAALDTLKKLSHAFDIRKYAACTKESGIAYYILCGWMSKKDSRDFENEINANEPDTICIIDEAHSTVEAGPPTKLKNPGIFRPYEMYIKMYGMPAYNEIDPTIFVALTYSFIFGAMFGDVGHGLLLLIGGALLYKIKKMSLAAIISCAGFFSTIFGFMFGSIFGFEEIIEPVWLRPTEAMTTLPFIGKLNTVFVVAIAFGMFLIIVAMILNIINAVKAKDKGRMLLESNGLAGLVFYGSAVLCIVLFMTDNALPATAILVVMFVIPLILIALKEPIMNKIEKKKSEEGVGMFIVQTFFELFELLLSYFSNSLSFVRVGAFAVSHAAMMQVVLMLAGAEHGGFGNPVVIVIGNLFVCGLEGLIVGIQVLRLEYYEMFSRFYKGNGREFVPYGRK